MEHTIANNRKANGKTLICVLLLALFLLVLLWRAPFGYDWTDEEYYSVVAYRILQGDRPLADTWEVHQFSGIIAAPVVGAYRLLNGGSMDGSVLFLRYFYVSFQFLVSLFAFFTLRKNSGAIPALLTAGMLLAYTHFAINSFYYDSMTCLFTVISVLFLFRFYERATKGYALALLGGVSFALAVIAFPYALAVLPVYLVYFFIQKSNEEQKKRSRLGALYFLLGMALTGGLLCAFILSRTSFSEAISGIRSMLSDPDHQSVSALKILGQYFNTIRVMYSPFSYAAVGLVIVGGAYRWIKAPRLKKTLRLSGFALALVILAGVTVHSLLYKWEPIYQINMLVMGPALIAPGLLLLADGTRNRAIFLYAAGCALSLAAQYGSNTRILASSGMLLLASMAAVLYLFDFLQSIRARADAEREQIHPAFPRKAERVVRYGATVLCALFVIALLGLRVSAVHRDEPVGSLTAVIDSGAAQGIRTTPESAKRHHEIVDEIRRNAPKTGSILITFLFPEGYLLTDLKAATPSAFNMAMDSAWLAAYYAAHPDCVPDVVYALNPDLPYNDPSRNGIDAFAKRYGFTLQQGTYLTILNRTD